LGAFVSEIIDEATKTVLVLTLDTLKPGSMEKVRAWLEAAGRADADRLAALHVGAISAGALCLRSKKERPFNGRRGD
jgi:hypothetical protein